MPSTSKYGGSCTACLDLAYEARHGVESLSGDRLRASLKWARRPLHAPAASRGRHTDISLTMPPKRAKKTEGPVEEPAKAAKRAKASAPAASKTLTIEACKS